jgi:hypothetical protein
LIKLSITEAQEITGASLQDDQGLRAQLSKVTAGSLALEEFDVQISKCGTLWNKTIENRF